MRKLFTIFTLLLLTVGFAYGKERRIEVRHNKWSSSVYDFPTITLDWSDGSLRWSIGYGAKQNGDTHKEIMPIENAYSIKEVCDILRRYDFTHQRRVSFEYIVLEGMVCSFRHF